MNHSEFEKLVTSRLDGCVRVLLQKNKEYSSTTDRLHNFKRAGIARNESSIKALDGMLIKHIVSFWDIVDKMEEDPQYVPTKHLVSEKLGDIINYLLLAEGLIEDRRKEFPRKPIFNE